MLQHCQERIDHLIAGNNDLKEWNGKMVTDLAKKLKWDMNADISELPLKSQALDNEWILILDKLDVRLQGITDKDIDDRLIAQKDFNEERKDFLARAFTFDTFVPLSDVKHAAPPDWASRVHSTLPPSGKSKHVLRSPDSSVKMRHSDTEMTSRPRPRSANLSPYRGMESAYRPLTRNNIKSSVRSPRSGSLSPNSVSPTR